MLACIKTNPSFTAVNRSSLTIDSLIISNNEKFRIKFLNIEPDGIVDGIIDMSGTPIKDGNYFLIVYHDNEERSKHFGYFTNGASLDYHFGIRIENDTILVTH